LKDAHIKIERIKDTCQFIWYTGITGKLVYASIARGKIITIH
jgi:hypothetical protein